MRSPGPGRWLILIGFLAGGVALTAFEPTRDIGLGPVWLLGSLVATVVWLRWVWRATRLDRLRDRGDAAQAVALAVRETGLVIHEMPRLELDLRVQAPGGGYELTKRVVVPRSEVESLRAGEVFAVRVDPADRDALAFDWPAYSGQRSSWVARAGGGPETIDEAALAEEGRSTATSGT